MKALVLSGTGHSCFGARMRFGLRKKIQFKFQQYKMDLSSRLKEPMSKIKKWLISCPERSPFHKEPCLHTLWDHYQHPYLPHMTENHRESWGSK